VPHQRFDALAAVYVANLLAHENEETASNHEWDLGFLEGVGATAHLPVWRTMAREMALAQQESASARSN
jgi:hypothetical protein